jgi:hypothetical protein
MRRAVGLALILAGPAAAQPPRCAVHEAGFPALVGRTEAEAIAALEQMPGIRMVRVGAPGSPMTTDYRQERATILLRDGKVVEIRCG